MKLICIVFLSFLNAVSVVGPIKAAEIINIEFEEMSIPISIDQLEKVAKYKNDSTELIDWFKNNGFEKLIGLSKFLEFPIFRENSFTKEILRSWAGRKILSELSNSIRIPNDGEGIEIYNTIELLLERQKQVSTIEILKALPSDQIILDLDNLISIISTWKNELAIQQLLLSKLDDLEKINKNFVFKSREEVNEDIKPEFKKINVEYSEKPLNVEIWKSKNQQLQKELIIFMPGLGGDISNFRWLGFELAKLGWPVLFIDHSGSNSEALLASIKGEKALPGGADFFLYRLKELDTVIKSHKSGLFDVKSDSHILMGHSLGALIAFLYQGDQPQNGFESRCNDSLNDFALTNLSKLLQCQLSEIQLPKFDDLKNTKAIIGFNTFGSLIWPNQKSSGIDIPVLLIGGTYDLITPLATEQFNVFLSTKSNLKNRFLIVEGASHFSPIRVSDVNSELPKADDIFILNDNLIGSSPNDFQSLSIKVVKEFLFALNEDKEIDVVNKNKSDELNFHIFDKQYIKKILEN